jgi:hypothetical protein
MEGNLMAKKKAPTKKKKPLFKELEEKDIWESGKYRSEAAYLHIIKRDKKGISFKAGTTNPSTGRLSNKSVWIDDDIDLPSWLNWFIRTLKKGYFKLFNRKLEGFNEEKIHYETKIDQLTNQLVEAKLQLEVVEKREEETKEILEYAKNVKGKHEDFKKIYKEFVDLIKESVEQNKGMENKVSEKIKQNHWLLGLDCFVEAKNQNIDNQLQIDLHIKTKYEQDKIFELKSPNVKLFVKKSDGKNRRLVMSPELADGISEILLYLRRTNIYSEINTPGAYGVQDACGYIVAGYNLTKDEKELVKNLNFHLHPHIQIITYNDLIPKIKRELDLIIYEANKGGIKNGKN